MAEGDEVTRSQEPHQGLRRRRRTSDSNTGVNHVSSTTLLGLCPGAWVPGPRSSRTRSWGKCVARMQVPI
ncbi:hypothetical protein FD754_001161 [Muntiacus muntjak]|uniref:Uncharacterized protein n=1 Tax=Muntiacus muntjak TaxID=9888 RepID=A0A5N3W8I7_MUNMU|nr:hypothetical protein FD754_001161 [Muntiacus muntjak]